MSRAVAVPQSAAAEWSGARVPSRLGTGWESAALLLLTVVLLSFGIVSVYSASSVLAQSQGQADYHYVMRQVSGAAMGFAVLVVMAFVDYRRLRMLAWPMLFVLIAVLVVMVLPGLGDVTRVRNGAGRWLNIGPVALQPSEFAKLALIIWTAMMAVKKQDKLSSLSRGLVPFLLVWGAVSGLIIMQPSMSAAMLVVLLSALVVFAGGARIGHFLLLAFVAIPLLWSQVEGVAYRARRIAAFLDPSIDPEGLSYQITQALTALGSGGVFGRGFGHGVQKFGYVPEPHNDFIFAMIGEEWGFAGALGIIVLFTGFALVGYRIARQAPDLFGFLLAVGVTNLIAVQALLHIAVNMALLPTTGVTLPFMSYGRSSLLVCLAGVGILINIARRAEETTA
ncbi:MAG TPA: putative lipid II flippase FtsW [Longimicrobiales bacterium]|nr:putative lipid II flippase FtsW [Longimicrobiales bacterium]